MKKLVTLAASALLALATGSSYAAADDANRIVIHNFMFQPTTLTVKAGSTVTWVNMDEEPHTTVSVTGLFRSAALDTSNSYSFTFDKPGTYLFVCSIHPQMTGTIVVQ
jgi:plastocyanin